MTDRREEILKAEHQRGPDSITPEGYSQWVLNAMDENGKQMCLDLLEYMAKNDVKCTWYEHEVKGIVYTFHYKGESISKEQLFENFL